MINLRERLDFEDKKLRNFLKKGYLSGEEEEEDGLIDEEQEDFLMYYNTKFETMKKTYKDELTVLLDLPKKKRAKNQKQIKNIQSMIGYMEEHEYYLEQLLKNKELIDQDKLDNIRDDMDTFLMHPGNKDMREELKAEYQHMLEDIVQELEEQKIEQQKLDIEKEAEAQAQGLTTEAPTDPTRPKTRKELREERMRMEKMQEDRKEDSKMDINKTERYVKTSVDDEEEKKHESDNEDTESKNSVNYFYST